MDNNLKILYVEDDRILGKITSDLLIKNGFTVYWSYDATTALDMCNKTKFDLCIFDIMLPDMDGYELIREVRNKEAEVPVIFLTSRILVEDLVKGFDMGGNDYIKKPFRMEELIVRINALIQRKSTLLKNTRHKFKLGLYSYDYKAMQLNVDNYITRLTHQENELLYLLFQNQGEITLRKNALLKIWGNDNFFYSRSLDVYISKLRKYLAKDNNITIINIRGLGYKLIVT